MIIIIDPGHGGDDSGAICPEFYEKDMNLKISLYQFERFKELGVDVGITRTTDKTLPLGDRGHIVRTSGAKVCLCNHNNAATTPNADGATAIYSIYSDGKFADLILNEIKKEGQKIREAYQRVHTINKGLDYYYMHRETGNVETVIIEYAFLTNVEDRHRIRDNYKRYAEAVIRACCEYLDIKYAEPDMSVPESNAEPKDDGLWILQVGAYKDHEKAMEVADKIRKAGFEVFIHKKG